METTDLHKPSSLRQFFLKPCLPVTSTTAIVLLLCFSLKGVSSRHGFDSTDKASDGFSFQHRLDNDNIYTVSTTSFIQMCQTGDVYQLEHFSRSNQSSIVPTPKKVACPRILKPAHDSLPLTALLSFPGSGNTWTRHLLQQLTGIGTGAVYNDDALREKGFPFEGHIQNVVAVKTHNVGFRAELPLGKFKRVILVLRNVFESILADFKRKQAHGNHTSCLHVDTKQSAWRHFLPHSMKKWDKFMKDAFSYSGPTLIVFYEDLKSQLLPQLKRMADFLTHDHLKDFSFCCALKDSEGAFHRKPSNQTIEKVYRKDDRILVNEYIEGIAEFLYKTHPEISTRILAYRMPISFL